MLDCNSLADHLQYMASLARKGVWITDADMARLNALVTLQAELLAIPAPAKKNAIVSARKL